VKKKKKKKSARGTINQCSAKGQKNQQKDVALPETNSGGALFVCQVGGKMNPLC